MSLNGTQMTHLHQAPHYLEIKKTLRDMMKENPLTSVKPVLAQQRQTLIIESQLSN